MPTIFHKLHGKQPSLSSLLLTNLLVSFLYVLSEWAFIVTKPSFLTPLPLAAKIGTGLYGAILFSTLGTLLLLILTGLDLLIKKALPRVRLIRFGFLLPILTAALTVFLLIDNFTYTLFQFGVVKTEGWQRAAYALGLVLIGLIVGLEVLRFATWLDRNGRSAPAPKKRLNALTLTIILLALVALAVPLGYRLTTERPDLPAVILPAAADQPNILLFTIDGLNANHMSLYGYERDTTPFLRQLAPSSLVGQNVFSNAQGTSGSITSILTGRYPMDTRVLAAEDILRGSDSFQHLPGILKSYGYQTYQFSLPWYADAINLNFLRAFDMANGRRINTGGVLAFFSEHLPSDLGYFNVSLYTRLSDRLLHIFYLKQMENPYFEVTRAMERFNDPAKLESLYSLLKTEDAPLFVHFHWLGTHGPRFYPQNQVFSAGKPVQSQEKYDLDLYDDSILQLDRAIQQLYSDLESGDLSTRETVLVIASDHSLRWTKSRLPLIIHFPGDEHAGEISENAQNLDIAPTILDYLDIDQPDWMSGQSLLTPLDKQRPIFTTVVAKAIKKGDELTPVQLSLDKTFAPFGRLAVTVCDTWHEVNLRDAKVTYARVADYEVSCYGQRITSDTAVDLLLDHLQGNGFNTRQLEQELTVP